MNDVAQRELRVIESRGQPTLGANAIPLRDGRAQLVEASIGRLRRLEDGRLAPGLTALSGVACALDDHLRPMIAQLVANIVRGAAGHHRALGMLRRRVREHGEARHRDPQLHLRLALEKRMRGRGNRGQVALDQRLVQRAGHCVVVVGGGAVVVVVVVVVPLVSEG